VLIASEACRFPEACHVAEACRVAEASIVQALQVAAEALSVAAEG
jgi:hypothetical protein